MGADQQRPWLVINNNAHPFVNQQYIAVAISTKSYADSIPITDEGWAVGGVPRQSYISPWAIHSPRTEDLGAWQGRLTESFVAEVIDAATDYLQ